MPNCSGFNERRESRGPLRAPWPIGQRWLARKSVFPCLAPAGSGVLAVQSAGRVGRIVPRMPGLVPLGAGGPAPGLPRWRLRHQPAARGVPATRGRDGRFQYGGGCGGQRGPRTDRRLHHGVDQRAHRCAHGCDHRCVALDSVSGATDRGSDRLGVAAFGPRRLAQRAVPGGGPDGGHRSDRGTSQYLFLAGAGIRLHAVFGALRVSAGQRRSAQRGFGAGGAVSHLRQRADAHHAPGNAAGGATEPGRLGAAVGVVRLRVVLGARDHRQGRPDRGARGTHGAAVVVHVPTRYRPRAGARVDRGFCSRGSLVSADPRAQTRSPCHHRRQRAEAHADRAGRMALAGAGGHSWLHLCRGSASHRRLAAGCAEWLLDPQYQMGITRICHLSGSVVRRPGDGARTPKQPGPGHHGGHAGHAGRRDSEPLGATLGQSVGEACRCRREAPGVGFDHRAGGRLRAGIQRSAVQSERHLPDSAVGLPGAVYAAGIGRGRCGSGPSRQGSDRGVPDLRRCQRPHVPAYQPAVDDGRARRRLGAAVRAHGG